ncbi:hypothetical protein ACFX1X_014295 [Malus domestica]
MVLAVAIATLVVSTGITSSLFTVLYNKLADLTLEKIGKNDDVADKLQKLARTLLKIESLVDDMENKQTNSNFCEMLIEHVKSALFDAEDLLDKIDFGKLEFKTAILSVKSEGEVAVIRMLERVEDLVKEMEGYLLSEINKKRSPPQSLDVNPRTSSLVDKLSVFGRDNEKEKMVEMLLAQRTENVSVIPIWGMGGTGKTTLAQLVYNDQAVVRNFKLRMWVCFSSLDTDLVTVTKSIYESATNEVLELPNLDAVQVALQEKMRRKKFLLVLDGMWNENPAFWDALKLPFRFAAPGSNIVVTTRSKIVSLIVSTGERYDLHTLSGDSGDEACRDIIKQSFGGNLDGHGDLWKIAKKCKGLPLAAKVIGRVLRFKLGTKEWDHILNYELWDFPEDYKSQIYPVLKVSYDHLPSNLKRCFGYCSIFPHKFQFEEDDLIQLWAAEGFIQPQRTRSVQGIGREYIDFLLSRSLFQVSPNDADRQTEAEPHGGQVPPESDLWPRHCRRKYEIHGFIHDMARLVSANLCFRLEDSMSTFLPSKNVRHSSLLRKNIEESTLKEFHRYEKLRTFILHPEHATSLSKVPEGFFKKLPCLRVLNLSRSQITELTESIETLMHLRYLNLNNTPIKKLPKTLTNIHGLEVLKLENCSELLDLPKNLKNLSKLRRLDFDRSEQISSLPKEIGKLTLLEILPVFKVGIDGNLEALKNMTCLRGSISIKNLENVADVAEAKGAILHNKQYLESLGLHWNNGTRDATVEQAVLEGLKPHDRLKRLKVVGYLGSKFPDWIGQSSFGKLDSCLTELRIDSCPNLDSLPALRHLTSLETLGIDRCPQLLSIPGAALPRSLKHLSISSQLCTRLPSLGQLPVLKDLVIGKMGTLTNVDRQFCRLAGSFPSLETLTFCDMPELSIGSGINNLDMPRLIELRIDSCPNLVSLPSVHHLTSLETLDINDCPQLPSIPGKGLPRSLTHLSISDSDSLKEWCKGRDGDDWSKIRWILEIVIDGDEIPIDGRGN